MVAVMRKEPGRHCNKNADPFESCRYYNENVAPFVKKKDRKGILGQIAKALDLYLTGKLKKGEIAVIATGPLSVFPARVNKIAGFDYLDLADIEVVKNPKQFAREQREKLRKLIGN